MIRAQGSVARGVVHLWAPDPVKTSDRALCGEAGPAIGDQTGNLCATCWRIHGGLLGSAFGRSAAARH
ncbi:hypothetical protein JOF56_006417 [Kibdelosporangium banguiense]|uniref:Uncharacterized protein n=1 Tax=Kibdelosporangium banguiense TaxID=1365924 RepID=A0ABS4TNP8_9PSEU|nr:hypothetical protein [Kibdelosporangium banguiense]MBP2326032.1 hypothetical protein [Kibdelosporangium banguiense]